MAGTALRQTIGTVGRSLGRGNRGNFVFLARHASNAHILKSSAPDVEIPNCSIPDFIFEKTGSYANKIAFECGVTGRRYTYDEIRIKARNFNRALRKKLKLQPDDVVAVMLPNVPEFPIAVLGILLAGLRVTTLNPIYTADEVKKQLDDSGTKAIVTLTELYPTVKTAIARSNIPVITINDQTASTTPEGTINFYEFSDNAIDYHDVQFENATRTVLLPYSSGTTGLPKGVCLSDRNIIANIVATRSPEFAPLLDATDNYQEIIPLILPMYHIYGLSTLFLTGMVSGSKQITLPIFTPDLFLKTLVNHKPTALYVVPPIVIFMYASPLVKKEHLDSFKVVGCGAAPLAASDESKLAEKVGRPISIRQGYGLTETSPVIMMTSNFSSTPGSVGNVVTNTQVKVVALDDLNSTLGPNKEGEILVKGPQVMKEYLNRPKETSDTVLEDGWLRTGDVGYYTEKEHFFITDRIKELIKVKGFQVPPAELEAILRDFPNVADAAVIGVPHKTAGEAPRAYIVPKANTKIDVEALHAFVKTKVAEFKYLKGGIVLTDVIPKNPSGKIMRRQLKERYLKDNV